MIKVIELFAGIGAQRQALKEAKIEHEVVAISEIDKYAISAYEKLHGAALNLGDISKIERLPQSDMWTYSFPCTDISLAGRMGGFEKGSNTHSSLLWEVQRLIDVAHQNNELPKYLIMENVKNLVSKRFKHLFDEWVNYLSKLGYKSFYKILNARDYGVPQNRERVFMVSILDCTADYEFPQKQELKVKLGDLLEENVDDKYFLSDKLIDCFTSMKNRNGLIRGLRFRPRETSDEYAWTITTCPGSRATDTYIIVPQNTKAGYAIAYEGDGVYTNRCESKRGVVQRNMIPTLKTSCADIAVVVKDPNELISLRRLTPRECWRLMGWEDGDINKVMDGSISNTQLFKMAGNSIVVNCLKEIFFCLDKLNYISLKAKL